MTAKEAKQISIVSYLVSQGNEIKKQNQNDTWFLSPIHQEKTPSFKVSNVKNLWFDHAQGIGGNILDLVMALNNCDVSGALRILDNGDNSSFSFSPAQPLVAAEKEDEFIIVAVKTLSNPALVSYLQSRGIDIAIAKKFSAEIFFKKKKSNGKNLFAIAFKNDEDGYETRNALYKGNIGGKAITTIKGKGNGKVAVFEGFMDFLSMLTKYNMLEITDDVIVLNSLSMIESCRAKLQGYDDVKYFLDNDKAGKEATADLLGTVGGKDYSVLYRGHKDANDWLIGEKSIESKY